MCQLKFILQHVALNFYIDMHPSHLELPVQVLHAGPHLVFRERPVPRDDLHDTEV